MGVSDVEVEAEVIRQGDAAVLVEVEGDEAWVPHSQLGDESEITADSRQGDYGALVVSSWLAKREGWA